MRKYDTQSLVMAHCAKSLSEDRNSILIQDCCRQNKKIETFIGILVFCNLNHRGAKDTPWWKILPLNLSNNIRHDAFSIGLHSIKTNL